MKKINVSNLVESLELLGAGEAEIHEVIYSTFYGQEWNQPVDDLLEAIDEMLENHGLQLVVGEDDSTITWVKIEKL